MSSLQTRPRLKSDIVAEIARLVGADTPPMSTGSTEPKKIFVLVNERLGLGVDPSAHKVATAKGIVEASGATWQPDFDSRGATVTRKGLIAVLDAVKFFVT